MYLVRSVSILLLAGSLAACGSSKSGGEDQKPFCYRDEDCDDNDHCTSDWCITSSGQCQNEPLGYSPADEGPPGDATCQNQIDDDCDGRTDADDPDCGEVCDSDEQCDDENSCTTDLCLDGECQNDPVDDQTACDDGLACTSDDVCLSGVCGGTEMDCSHLDTQCTKGACNEYLVECVAVNLDSGIPCEVADPCSVTALCREGECIGNNDKDSDGDGYVDADCPWGKDCDDDDPDINPDAVEAPPWGPLCQDGIDNDCSGLADAQDYSCMQELGFCDILGWCWENPLPQGNHLYGVWALGPDDIWVVGASNTVLHLDETGWYPMSSMIGEPRWGVWAAGPERIWTIQGNYVNVWNGIRWRRTRVSSRDLYAIWGSSDSDIWTGGEYYSGTAALYHFDGAEWHDNTLASGGSLSALWGFAPDDVWAVGGGPRIWNYDGSTWNTSMEESGGYLAGVWGSGPDDIWAVGDDAVVYHWEGDGWNSVDLGVTSFESFNEVWGSSPEDVWVSGVRSGKFALLHHWDGVAWSQPEEQHGWIGDGQSLTDTDALAVGQNGFIMRYNGSTWDAISRDVVGSWTDLRGGCSPAGSDSAWLVGGEGSIIRRDALSGTWDRVESGVNSFLYDVTCPAAGMAWAVGMNGTILRWDEPTSSWILVDSGIQSNLRAVWSDPAGDEAWAVGNDGVTLHFSAGNWTQVPSDVSYDLVDVWGSAPGDVWAISEQGPLLHWEGDQWGRDPKPASEDLKVIYGLDQDNIWLGGTEGAFYKLNPESGAWERIIIGSSETIRSIWARSADDLWVAAYNQILHWDGESWERERTNTIGVSFIWGNDQGDLWTASSLGGRIIHRLPR